MRQPAYIFSTLDDEPIVPALSDYHNNRDTVKSRQSNTTAMDHQTTGTTLRTSTKKPMPHNEREELELDHLIRDNKEPKDDTLTRDEEPQTLNKRDYGNFALLVILCKYDNFITSRRLLNVYPR